MPTIDRFGPYRVYFYMADFKEPPHVHVERNDLMVKIWLSDLQIAINCGFSSRELAIILKVVTEKKDRYVQDWNRVFG
ncbi:MAG: DUF4160 domain-containing protein [Bdellovibrionales bacterium]